MSRTARFCIQLFPVAKEMLQHKEIKKLKLRFPPTQGEEFRRLWGESYMGIVPHIRDQQSARQATRMGNLRF